MDPVAEASEIARWIRDRSEFVNSERHRRGGAPWRIVGWLLLAVMIGLGAWTAYGWLVGLREARGELAQAEARIVTDSLIAQGTRDSLSSVIGILESRNAFLTENLDGASDEIVRLGRALVEADAERVSLIQATVEARSEVKALTSKLAIDSTGVGRLNATFDDGLLKADLYCSWLALIDPDCDLAYSANVRINVLQGVAPDGRPLAFCESPDERVTATCDSLFLAVDPVEAPLVHLDFGGWKGPTFGAIGGFILGLLTGG